MRILTVCLSILFFTVVSMAQDNSIPEEVQIQIITSYMTVTGQKNKIPQKYSLADNQRRIPIKCGTPAVLDFVENYDKLNRDLMLSLGVDYIDRPVLDSSYDSPGGYFKLHYNIAGDSAVYQASVDVNVNGVPDYVEQMALIADSVYAHVIDTLGYPAPPTDAFYDTQGGDGRYDIYILDLNGGAYGLDYIDERYLGPRSMQATSFIVLDNDYYEYYIYEDDNPQPIYLYRERPLDAVRVTMAHEYFHAVQFGLDFQETEPGDVVSRRYWMEISAVWMEEEIYDNINDYYTYLEYFFSYPQTSLQQFNNYSDIHPYASVVFALYLSETYGRDVIRNIWFRCAEYGAGPHFLIAANEIIDSAGGGEADFNTAFRDFALWNFFTGPNRSAHSPDGMGYSERANYPEIPYTRTRFLYDAELNEYILDTILVIDTQSVYPVLVRGDLNPITPEHNAAVYLQFTETRTIHDKYWYCNDGSWDRNCYDTTITLEDTIFCDSLDCQAFDCNYMRVCDSIMCDSFYCDTIVGSYDTIITVCREDRCHDSVQVSEFDAYGLVDSTMYVSLNYDTLTEPWGLNVVFQLESNPDSYFVEQYLLPGDPLVYGNLKFLPGRVFEYYNPDHYRSITFIATPASTDLMRYVPLEGLIFGYWVPEEGELDSSLINVRASVLFSYPNPAVVSRMKTDSITFRFQVPTDTTSFPTEVEPMMVVDIFNIAGEYVATVEREEQRMDRLGWVEVGWDMKNAEGEDVASGVYLAYARLYSDRIETTSQKRYLLAEDKVKVAIIR
ncbi:MAG: MXAN_6640 family putative metalloprotease [Candidatus Zixiibacteriota bacterium]